MGTLSTFGAFTTAQLGIYAAQRGLMVTGNNISNINTPGYTRQKIEQVSLYNSGTDRYVSQFSTRIGNGALVTGVSQMRDPYLDIRYRTEMARVGYNDAKLGGLNQLASIIDEVGKGEDEFGVLEAALSNFATTLRNLDEKTGQDEFDTQVRTAASELCRIFNSYSDQLNKLERNTSLQLDQDLKSVNDILSNIRDLNDSIRKSEIHGDNALEQRDERNRLIDELSSYMRINATYTMEDIGAGIMVEKLTITLDGNNPDPKLPQNATLVDGIYATQISMPETLKNGDKNNNYTMKLDLLKDQHGDPRKEKGVVNTEEIELGDTDMYGALQAVRELLTRKGEYSTEGDLKLDPDTAKRGIPYYKNALDQLAKQFAETMNAANHGYMVNEKGEYLDKNGDPVEDPENLGHNLVKSDKLTDAQKQALEANCELLGSNLFSINGNSDATTDKDADGNPIELSAGTISVAKSWATGENRIVRSFLKPTGMDTASTDSSNIAHMLVMMDTKQDYVGPDGKVIHHGSFQERLTDIGTVLGNDQKSTGVLLDNYYISSVDLDSSRDSVSSVDLNDEAANLIQYQKAYSAACRLLTTLDEALEKLINGTGVVGR